MARPGSRRRRRARRGLDRAGRPHGRDAGDEAPHAQPRGGRGAPRAPRARRPAVRDRGGAAALPHARAPRPRPHAVGGRRRLGRLRRLGRHRHLRHRPARGGRDDGRGRRGARRHRGRLLRARPAARPPRDGRGRRGLLRLRERRPGRHARAGGARGGPRRGRRLGRPPRQRDAGRLLDRARRPGDLAAPGPLPAALRRPRGDRRGRRRGAHDQRPAAGRIGRGRLPRRHVARRRARAARVPAGARRRGVRLRRQRLRPAGADAAALGLVPSHDPLGRRAGPGAVRRTARAVTRGRLLRRGDAVLRARGARGADRAPHVGRGSVRGAPAGIPGQALEPHQREVVDRAAALAARL